ncbi:MAG TPA: hypothetical protein VG842_07960, partial [Sediminibacterium sp.]|nr:hypothetical protein [Sediminibacterium sp.]
MSLHRRKFLGLTAGIGALAISPFEELLSAKPAFTVPKDFKVILLGTNWGFNGTIDAFCAKAKQAGYDGIEVWWPGSQTDQQALFSALSKHDLSVGFLAGGSDKDPATHFKQFKNMVDGAADP